MIVSQTKNIVNTNQNHFETHGISVKIQRIWQLVYELGLKEIGSVFTSIYNKLIYWFHPHIYQLNPQNPVITDTAKVIILLHGAGGGPFCFLPLAKKLKEKNIQNVYAIHLKQTDEDPVPVSQLAKEVNRIAQKCFDSGAGKVSFALIGHSLGALVASKYIWRTDHDDSRIKLSLMVSLAGRMRYIPNQFSWFCQGVRQEIEETFSQYQKHPDKALLYTIRGSRDQLVPEDSVHIQQEPERELTVKGYGHGGIVYSTNAHDYLITWITDWISSN